MDSMQVHDSSRVREHLLAWGTARPTRSRSADATGTAVVVLADGAHVEPLLASDVVGAATVVLSPEPHADPRVAEYRGSLVEPGDEAAIEERVYLQTLEYRSCAYVSMLAPTFARITDAGDLQAFLDDADEARATGQIPQFLSEPSLLLADECALGRATGGAGPRARLVVRADGSMSTSPAGLALGAVGSSLDQLAAAYDAANAASGHPCAVSLAGVVPDATRADALDERPWLGRYLAGVEATKEIVARGGTGVRVSGFGGRLGRAAEGFAGADDDAPALVLWSDDAAYVVDLASRRTLRLSRRAGELVELLMVAGGVQEAAGLGAADADDLARVDAALRAANLRVVAPALDAA